ncbi:MAG: sulfurtransferase [Actinomycetota bacterium]|nr:sulfurtransferase [Actinomycetota bacterium]
MAEYAKDVLVDTDWVAENLDNPDVRIVEVDEDTEAYQRGHIRNAVGVHWKNDLQDPLRREFVSAEGFAKLLDRIGVTNDTTVVLYGGNNNWFAAYAYWYFKVYGHDGVKLMNGGRKKWELEGRELTQDPPKAEPTTGYKVKGVDADIRAFRDYIEKDVLGKPTFGLVDVRSPEEFRGELLAPAHLPQEQAQKPGHIPGAKNIPWSKSVNPESGAFLSTEELKKLYGDEGITQDKQIVAYCRIGERSAHTWFVLHELLGFENVRNYDGSWTEWGSLVGVPIER